MIKLNLNEDKRLKFSYGVANVHPEDITGKLILDFGDAFIGFPIEINDSKMVINIKGLDRFLTEGGRTVDARLEVVANDTFITPWTGKVRIDGPVEMSVEEFTSTEKVSTEKQIDKYIEKGKEKPVESVLSASDNLRRLINLREEDIIDKVKNKEVKESENVFNNFLNVPIEELI